MLVENSHQLARRPSTIILFRHTIATSAATSSQCNGLLVLIRNCASWHTNAGMDTMIDKLYFDVTMPTGAVRIPLSTVTSFTAIRGYLQDNHRDKYGDLYVHDLTLYHCKQRSLRGRGLPCAAGCEAAAYRTRSLPPLHVLLSAALLLTTQSDPVQICIISVFQWLWRKVGIDDELPTNPTAAAPTEHTDAIKSPIDEDTDENTALLPKKGALRVYGSV